MHDRIQYITDGIIIGAAWVSPVLFSEIDYEHITHIATKSMQLITTVIILLTALIRFRNSRKK